MPGMDSKKHERLDLYSRFLKEDMISPRRAPRAVRKFDEKLARGDNFERCRSSIWEIGFVYP